jgi:hypothetical protein
MVFFSFKFVHTFICNLSPNHIFNKLAEAGLFNKSLCLAPTLGVTKFKTARDMILVTLC